MNYLRACLFLFLIVASTQLVGVAQAQSTVTVEVVDIAGRTAYLQPGASAGIRRGDRVKLAGRSYKVTATTASNAVIDSGKQRLHVGMRGAATTSPATSVQHARLPKVRALADFRGQWPTARVPAEMQTPKAVPLGAPVRQGRSDLWLGLRVAAVVPTSGAVGPIGDAELRGRFHYEPIRDVPWAIDADVALRYWLAEQLEQRSGRHSRPLARVRQLQTSYGSDQALYAALGRLRYAARPLGMLDGARIQTPLGAGFTLGAFGGFVPDPLDERPDFDARRFGVELGYQNFEHSLRPEISVTGQGSHFAGALDEGRITSFVDLYPGQSHIGGYAELSFFARDNAWNAPPQQLTKAGLDGSLRLGAFELSARFDMQRPERSRWLATYLPEGWLCTKKPALPTEQEACRGNDVRYLLGADAGVRLARWSLRAGFTRTSTANVDAQQLGAFLQAVVLDVIRRARLEGGLMASTGSVLHTAAANIGIGSPFLHDKLDIALRYRPALSRYEADTGTFLEHMAGASLGYLPNPAFSLTLAADFITGRDVDVLLAQTLVTYRPDLKRLAR